MIRALILLLALSTGCSILDSPTESVQIRIANESSVSFDQVVVIFPSQQENYGAIAPQGQSTYRRIEVSIEPPVAGGET